MSSQQIDREKIRPDETECHHRAERGLKLILENPDTKAVRIDSTPEPMYVTVEAGGFAFWCHNYTWRCQEQKDVKDATGRFKTVVDHLHGYANDGYGIGTVSKDRIDTERKPKGSTLGDFA